MSIVKMSKISLAADIDDKEKIVSKIMKSGVVEIVNFDSRNSADEYDQLVENDNDDDNAAKLETDMARIGAVIELLERYHPEKLPMFSSRKELGIDEYRSIVSDLDGLWKAADRLSKYDERLVALRAEENRHRNAIESLLPWRDLTTPLEITGTRTTKFVMGILPTGSAAEKIREELLQEVPECVMEVISADKVQSQIFAVYFAEYEEQVLQILKQHGFSKVQFKELTGSAAENLEAFQSRIQEIEKERNGIEGSIRELAVEKRKLQVLYDYLQIRCERRKIVSKFGRSERVFMVEGWVPTHCVDKLVDDINANFTCYIEVVEPEKGEAHPILLNNPKLVQPFEPITEMYSLPSVNDVDPNLVMAPFYFIFFGLMVGDFFYGVILALATLFMLKKFKPQGMAGRMLKMLCFGGISTALWGIVFGSYFGNLPQVLLGWLTGNDYSDRFFGLWFDTLSEPMLFLMFAMVLGGIHLFAGMGIKVYMLLKEKKVFEAIFDVGSWYILLVGVVLLMLGVGVGPYLAAAGVLMLVCTQGRDKKNPIAKLFTGILSLYDITAYLGDVLSYSRLLALGLGTGVVASVINTLATLSPPGIVSFVVFILVLIIGTVFNIAINALGAFVHTSRLQYVEFFGKFYGGGGESYKPFRINTKYIKINGGKVL